MTILLHSYKKKRSSEKGNQLGHRTLGCYMQIPLSCSVRFVSVIYKKPLGHGTQLSAVTFYSCGSGFSRRSLVTTDFQHFNIARKSTALTKPD